jgi:hypothetical protein
VRGATQGTIPTLQSGFLISRNFCQTRVGELLHFRYILTAEISFIAARKKVRIISSRFPRKSLLFLHTYGIETPPHIAMNPADPTGCPLPPKKPPRPAVPRIGPEVGDPGNYPDFLLPVCEPPHFCIAREGIIKVLYYRFFRIIPSPEARSRVQPQ